MLHSEENDQGRGQPFGREEDAGRALYSQYPSQAPSQPRKRGCMKTLLPLLIGALLCLIIGGLIGWGIGRGVAQQDPGVAGYKSGAMSVEQLIAQDRQAVVQINVQKGQGSGIGSGVIIDQQGDIVTNNHVVSGGQKFNVVLFDGTLLPAQLVGTDSADDLAVIRIHASKRVYAMPIGDSSKLQVGNPVLAIGNPLGITQTVTSGIVSALGRTVNEGKDGRAIVDAVQTDAAINPGNSGGALVDMNGRLIGIPTLVAIDPEFKTPASGVGFAIPSNRVRFIAPQLIQYGKVQHSGRASLGITAATVDSLVAEQAGLSVDHGALIVSAASGGPASQAGLKPGDVIVLVDSKSVNNIADLSDALLAHDPGATVTLSIVRGSQQMQVRVKLGELNVS